MKTIQYFTALLLCTFSVHTFAQTADCASKPQDCQTYSQQKSNKKAIITETMLVYGVCISCKEKIENAAKIRGVKAVEWTLADITLTVTYDSNKTCLADINNAIIAATGYKTSFSSSDCETQKKSSACCAAKETSEADCNTK